MRAEDLISRLEEERAVASHAALASPKDGTAFEYGRACGYYAGLARAKALLDGMLDEDRKKDL